MTTIKIRGKIWKQITKEEYNKLLSDSKTHHKIAFLKDIYYGEVTYFQEYFQECKLDKLNEKESNYE